MAECEVCANQRPGAWPAYFVGSHCGECHTSWSGARPCHCAGCCKQFASNDGFDAHRKSGRCRVPSKKDYALVDGVYVGVGSDGQ